MSDNRRRLGTGAAVLISLLALVLTLGLAGSPAHAQTTPSPTYAITSPATGATTTTTVAPTTTTKATSHLAFTGADIGITMGAAAVALGVGGTLVMASRKRKVADSK